jgi:peroxiredoxin
VKEETMKTQKICLALALVGCSREPAAETAPGPEPQDETCSAAAEPFGADAAAGESVPDVKLYDCAGARIGLEELRCEQSLTWVSVGAGWCQPCTEEALDLEAAQAAYGDRGVRFVQVLFEDAASQPATTQFCGEWVESFGLTIDVLIDPALELVDLFDRTQTPLNLLIDRDGKVVWSQLGKPDDIGAVVESQL